MGTTPIYGIPYPAPTDKPKDAPAQWQALALGVESALAAATIPPASPQPIMVAATAAARDAFWGVPVGATAQRTLQDRGAQTVRLDRGWTEQYYALYNASTNPGGAVVAGWWPVLGRREPLAIIPTSVTGGTLDALTGRITFSASAGVTLDGVFSAERFDYRLVVEPSAASVDSTVEVILRGAGVNRATNYLSTYMVGASTGPPAVGVQAATDRGILTASGYQYGILEAQISAPAIATAPTLMRGTFGGFTGAGNGVQGVSVVRHVPTPAVANDGILVRPASGTFTGALYVVPVA